MQTLSTTPPGANEPRATPTAPGGPDDLLLLARLGARRVALPAAAILRVLPMAALTPLPDAPPGVAGVLAVGGAALPVVDPRPRLGLPTPPPRPEQHLVAVAAPSRYLLWVDLAEAIRAVPATDRTAVAAEGDPLAPQLARVDGEYLPLLSLAALDPGPLLRAAPPVAR